MTKATIRTNLTIFLPDITATQEKGLEYLLGETNSYACHVSSHLAFLVFDFSNILIGCSWSEQFSRSCSVGTGLCFVCVSYFP